MAKKKTEVALAETRIVIDELAMDQGTFEITAMSQIRISKTNRKHFDEEKLQELAANIKEMGVAQPILIRPVTPTEAEPEAFEIVAGERRWRASNIAGLASIPAMIRTLTDLQAAKIQILENLQREDPHELEEALGYQNLMLSHGYSADQLAEELKKSRSYIYGRLKLCALAAPLHDDFLAEKFSASTALLVARIPVPALQVKAMREIMCAPHDGDPMSFRDAKRHVESRYMLRLVDAPFDTKNAKLTDAPSCAKCPKRTGNQPEIFSDIDQNICTDPDCFAEKKASEIAQKIYAFEKKNILVFRGEEGEDAAEDAFYGVGTYVSQGTQLTKFARVKQNGLTHNCIGALLSEDQLGSPAAYALTKTDTFNSLYYKDNVQSTLETLGACYTVLEAFDRNAPSQQSSEIQAQTGTTMATVTHDPYLERCKREDAAKDAAKKETAFRVALYKKVRQRGFDGLSLDSMRELVKLMLGTFALPDDLMSDVYPFGDAGTDVVVFEYLDQASMQEVRNILMDLVLGEALTISWRNYPVAIEHEDRLDFATLLSIAKTEGIDPDQLRAELDKPAEPEVDATPVKRPLLTLKKKPTPAEAWPLPTPNKETAGAA